jgi:hypothetical protein
MQRHIEVLQALDAHPDGITIPDVLVWCRAQVGSEIPNDKVVVSRILFSLRTDNQYVKFTDAPGGKLHKLTGAGKAALIAATGGNHDAPPANAPPKRRRLDAVAQAEQDDATPKPPVRIERKTVKIDALKRLGRLMNDDINEVLQDIAFDLAQLEELI